MNTRRSQASRNLGLSIIVRLLLLVAMLSSSVALLPPASAFAADVAAEQTSVTGVMDAQAASYLDQLLSEINQRRTRAGSPPVIYAGLDANLAVSEYLMDLTPLMVSAHSCFHGNGNPVSPGWDYVTRIGFRAEARGEVLACPGDNGYWTAAKIADGWWSSPSHWRSLYGDPRVNAIACGTFGPQNGGRAYQTIACVTYRV